MVYVSGSLAGGLDRSPISLRVGTTYLNEKNYLVDIVLPGDQAGTYFIDAYGDEYTPDGKSIISNRSNLIREAPKSTLRVEVGKTYKDVDGQYVFITKLESLPNDAFYWRVGSNGSNYEPDGRGIPVSLVERMAGKPSSLICKAGFLAHLKTKLQWWLKNLRHKG